MSRFERILLTVTFFIPYLLFPAGTLHLWFSTTKVRQKTRMTKYSVFAWLPYKGKKTLSLVLLCRTSTHHVGITIECIVA